MRFLQRNVAARSCLAVAAGVLTTIAAWRAGPLVLAAVAVVALSLVAFAASTVAPDAIARHRGHRWRWWRFSDDEGPFWPGTRIPRGRGPPRP